jgi:leader peptidase (prepilin peptidase)/N-methyltransferase
MTKYILILISTATLIYGGVVDYKRREIPNAVPIILTAIGVLFGFSISRSIIGLIVPAVLLLVVARIIKSEIPGGDFKLLCSLGFACGLQELAVIILLAGIGATSMVLFGICR